MIAKLTLTMGPRKVVAELGDDFVWTCEDLLTQTFLNECHGPPPGDSSEEDVPGYRQARKAADAVERVGWTAHLWVSGLQQDAA